MKKRIIICLLLFTRYIYSMNTPHAVYGYVKYSDGSLPSGLSLNAYITARPSEVLTENTTGCGYDPQSGIWYVQCANFPSSWAIDDTIYVTLNAADGLIAELYVILTGNPADQADDVVLARPVMTITVNTLLQGLTIYVNDSTYTSPHQFNWPAQSAQYIRVDSIYHFSGTRFIYQYWNDGSARERTFITPDHSAEITAYFNTQHYLAVESEYGSPKGEGWHHEGSEAEFSVLIHDSISAGIRAAFERWTGTGQGHYSGNDHMPSVIMNHPITQRAHWKMQYLLSVHTLPSAGGTVIKDPDGTWFDFGSNVLLSAVPNDSSTFDFDYWSGDIAGSVNPVLVNINNPKTIFAHFSDTDDKAPDLKYIYPAPGSKNVPLNAQLYFEINDPSPGTGINRQSLNLFFNTDTLIKSGESFSAHDQIQANNDNALQALIDLGNYSAAGDNILRLICTDFANPSNTLDTTIVFHVSSDSIIDRKTSFIDNNGGSITISNTGGGGIIVPYGALNQSMPIITGHLQNMPENSESFHKLGNIIYIGPDGFRFSNQISVKLSYDQHILQQAGVSLPSDLPVYRYSAANGQWQQMAVDRFTSNYIYIQSTDCGIYTIGDRSTTSVKQNEILGIPKKYILFQNFPNPFNQSTKIRFSLPEKTKIKITVLDIKGRIIKKLVDDHLAAGYHEFLWEGINQNGENVPSGVYFCLLDYKNKQKITKLILAK